MRSYFTLIGLNCFFIEASLRSRTVRALQSRYVCNADFRFGAPVLTCSC